MNFFHSKVLLSPTYTKVLEVQRKTNAVPCIVYFLILLRGKCRAKGLHFVTIIHFAKFRFCSWGFVIIVFQYCGKQDFEFCFLSIFFFYFIFQNFTSDIGKILELQDVENGLDDYRSTAYLTFEQYRYYLFKEVFSALPDEMSVQDTLKVSEFIKY